MDSYAPPTHAPKTQGFLTPIADAAYRSLKSALAQKCAERQSLSVSVRRTSQTQPMSILAQCSDRIEMTLRLTVQHVGGNVYDVHCTTDNGASHKLVYCLPDDAEPPFAPVPRLGHGLATFVLDELEHYYGRQHLRTEDS